MGLSGKSEDTESGDIFSVEPADRPNREIISHAAEGAMIKPRMRMGRLGISRNSTPMPRALKLEQEKGQGIMREGKTGGAGKLF
jgi:hypothetical protein